MALLKTDYKDYVPSSTGKQYRIETNVQGISTITDVTNYTVTGDVFSAVDINTTNEAVNSLTTNTTATSTLGSDSSNNMYALIAEYTFEQGTGDFSEIFCCASSANPRLDYQTSTMEFEVCGRWGPNGFEYVYINYITKPHHSVSVCAAYTNTEQPMTIKVYAFRTQSYTNIEFKSLSYSKGYFVSRTLYTNQPLVSAPDGETIVWAHVVPTPVSDGGTGLTELTSGSVLVGNGTNDVTFRPILGTATEGSTALLTSGGAYNELAKKLSLTGGNISGNVAFTSTTYPQISGNGSALQISVNQETGNGVVLQDSAFRPTVDSGNTAQLTLGLTNRRWNTVYAATGTIQTSDRNQKHDIALLDSEKTTSFIMGLKPSSFVFNDADSGRTHYGLISQDVEEVLADLGMSDMDFAGFIRSPKTEDYYEDVEVIKVDEETGEEFTEIEQQLKTRVIEGEYLYSLRYDEFIAPLISVVQEQQRTIEELKWRVSALEI